MKNKLKFLSIFIVALLLLSCSKEDKTPIIKARIANTYIVTSIDQGSLQCTSSNIVFDDVTYTTADRNIKVGDSINLVYSSSNDKYYIKENFPNNSKSNDETNRVFEVIIILGLSVVSVITVVRVHKWNYS